MAVVNAIIQVGNRITAAVTGSDAGAGGDSVRKALDALEKLMLPHRAEERDRRAEKAFKLLKKEHERGPLKIKVLGGRSRGKKRNVRPVR